MGDDHYRRFCFRLIFGLRVSPREKALGLMRDKARKMGYTRAWLRT
jgi:hypothetical protein